MDLASIKIASEARAHDNKQRSERHKSIMVLFLHYSKENGMFETADALVREMETMHQDVSGLKVCDNMDLNTVFLEYECNYLARSQKKPRFIRQLLPEELPHVPVVRKKGGTVGSPKSSMLVEKCQSNHSVLSAGDNLEICTKNLSLPAKLCESKAFIENLEVSKENIALVNSLNKLSDAVSSYEIHPELHELARLVSKEMYIDNPNVHWDDIKGMDDAKRLVKEAVVYPVKFPELFKGILAPWRGLLLAGPPGTGKTMLAKAVATECKTCFFNITASTLVSKWRGESEKLVRVLFEMARKCAPSCIFLDEIDSLMGQRGNNNEHEGSRRMKTEILLQMDGLQRSDAVVFVLAASNLPWELDNALMRRLEKRVMVDLPNSEARRSMLHSFLPPVLRDHPLQIRTSLDYDMIASKLTDGYSGSDLHLVAKESLMKTMRKIFILLEEDPGDGNTSGMKFNLDPITTEDVVKVLQHIRPTNDQATLQHYRKWRDTYESC